MAQSRVLPLLASILALMGCVPDESEETVYDENPVATASEAIAGIATVGTVTGGRSETVTFDSTNAYLASTYQSMEFCDESVSRVLIQKMRLATGVRTTLVQGTNLCTVAARSVCSDGTHAYYIRNSASTAIRRVTIAAPYTDSLVISDAATSLTVDGTNAYWTTTSLRKRAKGGGAITTLYTPPAGTTITILGTDSSQVFFDQATGWGSTQVHIIKKVPIAGGAATTLYTLEAGRALWGFSSYSNYVYWIERTWGNTLNGYVRRISKTGSGLHTISTSSTRDLHDLAVTSSKVYWVEHLGADSRSDSLIRSRTSPTGASGVFTTETPTHEGIGTIGDIKIVGAMMYWPEYPWSTSRKVMKGSL